MATRRTATATGYVPRRAHPDTGSDGHTVIVDFLRPYVAFWTAAGGVVLAGLGGLAGGMLPRRQAGHQVVELAPVSSIRAESLVMSNGPAAAGF